MELNGNHKWSGPVSLHSCRSPLLSMMDAHHHPPSPSLDSAASSSMALDDLSVSRMSLSSPSPSSTLEAEASTQTFCSRDLSPSPIPESPAPTLSLAPDHHIQSDIIQILRIQVGRESMQRAAFCKDVKPVRPSPFCIPSQTPLVAPSRLATPSIPKFSGTSSSGCSICFPSPPTPPTCSPPHSASMFRSARVPATSITSSTTNSKDQQDIYSTSRIPLIGYLHELSGDFNLQQETLFDCVCLLDRYMSAVAANPPQQELLQLIALACIFIVAKCEESHPCQPTAAEWIATTDSAFDVTSLLRMEYLILDTLHWDPQCPTAYSYLHLLCHALSTCSVTTICWATYLVELSLFDAQTQAHGHLQTAVAALLLAHLQSHSSASAMSDAINSIVRLDPEVVRVCASRLVQLHSSAAASPGSCGTAGHTAFCSAPAGPEFGQTQEWMGAVSEEQAEAVSPVRAKFSRAELMCVAMYPLLLPR